MAVLNEYNENTKKNIHLLVTTLCDRNCKYCCNKQYNLNDIPYVTDEELENAENIFITGGEPFLYSSPNEIAFGLKYKYQKNRKNIYVYTNAYELLKYLEIRDNRNSLIHLSGVTVSIKTNKDREAFEELILRDEIKFLKSNWLYVFNDLVPKELGNFQMKKRSWEPDFKPDPNSVFRKV